MRLSTSRFPPPLRHTVTATLLLIGAAVLSISYVLETASSRRRVEATAERRLGVLGAVLSEEVSNAIRRGEAPRISGAVIEAESGSDATVATLFDGSGRVRASTSEPWGSTALGSSPFAPLTASVEAVRSRGAASLAHLTGNIRAYIVPVELAGPGQIGSETGALVIALDMTRSLAEGTATARRRIATVTIVMLVISLVAWLLFKRMLLFRVNHLVRAAHRVGEGDFTADFTLPGRDELAVLGGALARMTAQLRAHAGEVRANRTALEASHERFAAVARATNDIIWDWDPRTDRIWRNEAVRTLLGYDEGWPADRLDWLRHVAPADHQRVEASFRQALASGAANWSAEYQLRRADGSLADIFDRAVIVRDERGEPVRMVGAMTDVSAQRCAEKEQTRLAAILEASPDFVGMADAVTLRVSWINRAGRRMVGLREDEDISHLHVQDFQPRWVLESLFDEIVAVAAAGGVWQGESGLLHRDGTEIPILKTVVAHRTRIGQAEYISTVARDIRDRKQLEAQLLQSQKMESIGRLAGGVAHDFNNMLTAIIGYTELAKAQLGDDHPAQDDLTSVHDAARRSAALTRQLLAFARKQVIMPRAVDLNALIGGLEGMLNRLLGEDIRLITRRDARTCPVLIDGGQFEQVLMNLAINSRDAMPDGGTLRIETANASLDEDWCHLHPGTVPGEYGLVRVSDTGSGMTRDVVAHLFEPFFTTKPSGEGTGLGLAMCYGIVKQSGGTIWVTSAPGEGTTFEIYLPRHLDAAAGVEHEAGPAARGTGGGTETILLIEDESFVRDLAERALTARGYRVLTAADGPTAIEVARTHTGGIDLVLSDVVMPHMGVAELTAKLRQHRPGVRVVFMSGYSEVAVHRHGVVETGARLIEKPFTPESLARQVRDAIDAT